jgi:EmrB/QacA subfamily drug resistance transporter
MSPTPSAARRKTEVLLICCLSLLLVSLDNTVVNVALPAIGTELGASVQSLQWMVGGYVLVLGSLLLLSGSLADRFGRKRVFTLGLMIFTSGSLLCGLASDEWTLIGCRMLQAVGGSMMTPVALAIISNVFTERAERARAIGWWGAVSGIGIAIGPLIGGVLVDGLGWRSVFWINVPLGVIAIFLAARFIPESTAAHPRPLDPVGQLLVIVLLGSVAVGIIESPIGWSAVTVAAVACGSIGGAAFVAWELHHPHPLVDLRLFADRPFTRAFITALVAFFAFAGLLFTNTFYLQDVRGVSATVAGALTLPLAAVVIIASPLSGRLVAGGRARTALVTGGLSMTVGAMSIGALVDAPVWALMLPYFIFGAGYGLLNDPINVTALSELPADQAALAAGIMSSAKQVGQLLGISVIGAVVATAPTTSLTDFAPAYVIVCGTLAVAGLVIASVNASVWPSAGQRRSASANAIVRRVNSQRKR